METLKSKTAIGHILVFNLGSSSLKFSLFHSISIEKEWCGKITGIGSGETELEIMSVSESKLIKKVFVKLDLSTSIKEIINWIEENGLRSKLLAIGYRVVQGGPLHICPEKVTEQMLKDLDGYVYLAPNHLLDELILMREFRKAYIGIPHVACFDTYFHKDMPAHAKFYPLPSKYREMGLHRYGFHGISYESIFKQLLEEDVDVAHQKIIIAHLGSGSSMVAIVNGVAKDTTMGVSPMGGLVMATRSGDLDPGAILFMLKQHKLSVEELDLVLSKESGLKAIAGTSDMQQILKSRHKDPKSAEAVELFCYQAKKQIGSLAAAMGGVDLLIFCGGIGENSDFIRKSICTHLDFLGFSMRVMHTDEETTIAMHVQTILMN